MQSGTYNHVLILISCALDCIVSAHSFTKVCVDSACVFASETEVPSHLNALLKPAASLGERGDWRVRALIYRALLISKGGILGIRNSSLLGSRLTN